MLGQYLHLWFLHSRLGAILTLRFTSDCVLGTLFGSVCIVVFETLMLSASLVLLGFSKKALMSVCFLVLNSSYCGNVKSLAGFAQV